MVVIVSYFLSCCLVDRSLRSFVFFFFSFMGFWLWPLLFFYAFPVVFVW